MAERRKSNSEPDSNRRPPATTPEARENQMIALAHDLAERRLREGSASAQEVTHWLKLGSSREKLEQMRLSMEVEMLEVKKEAIASSKRVEELMTEAMDAMRSYKGIESMDAPEPYDD